MSDEMEKALIIKRGRQAERQINGARLASQKAWNDWRAYETYKTPEGAVQSRISSVTEARTTKDGMIRHIQVDHEHPEHKRLREIAEEADRHLQDLEDDLEVYAAVAGTFKK